MILDVILIAILFHVTQSTVDLNLPELEYLADHLHPQECRRLVAALHFKSYEQPNALNEAEGKVSKDISCFRLLLHWNSAIGEGKGETHEAVQHRLRQIGRVDLADWLAKTVFHQLGKEMDESLNEPFKSILNTDEKRTQLMQPTFEPQVDNVWDPTEWIAFDTVCWVFLVGLSLLTLGVLAKVICIASVGRWKRKRKYQNKNYKKLESIEDTDSSESEDRFDIRDQNITNIKMHKYPGKSNKR